MLMAEAMLYIIIFAKEDLNLNNHKAGVLVSILETLFKNDNPSYEVEADADKQTAQEKIENQFPPGGTQSTSPGCSSIENKELHRDLEVFKKVLLDHCIHNPPSQVKIFEPYQVAQILQYVSSSYVETFSLYKYIFLNKKKNEEIRLNVYIDQPLIAQPLSEALYMGYDYQPILDGGDEESEYVKKINFYIKNRFLEGDS